MKIDIGDTATDRASGKQIVWSVAGWVPAGTPEGESALESARIVQREGDLNPSTLASVGGGIDDVYQGAMQITGMMTPEQESEISRERAAFNQHADTGDQIARIAGQAVATSPIIGPASLGTGLLTRAVAGGAAGAAAGALPFADEPHQRVAGVIGGGVGGATGAAVLPPLMRGADRAAGKALRTFRRVWGAVSPRARSRIDLQIDDGARALHLDPSAITGAMRATLRRDALSALSAGDDLNPEAVARHMRARLAGFTDDAAPTRAQLTRNPVAIGDEREAAKRAGGEALLDRYQNQEQRMLREVDALQSTPGARSEVVDAGEAGERAVRRVSADLQRRVRRAYQSARASYGDGAGLSVQAFDERMTPILREWEDAISDGVKSRIRQFTSGDREFTPLELEKFDQYITGSIGPMSEPNKQAAASLLKRELVRVWGDSGYAAAKREASRRFRLIGNQNRMPARLLRERYEPDRVVNTLISGNYRDVHQLHRLIGEEPEWGQLGDAVLQKVIAKSFKNSRDAVAGSTEFSAHKFSQLIDNMDTRRLNLLFGAERAQSLRRLARVGNDLFSLPRGHTVNNSNTGVTIGNSVLRLIQSAMGNHTMPIQIPQGGQRITGSVVREMLDPIARMPARPLSESAQAAARSVHPALGAAVGAGRLAPGLMLPGAAALGTADAFKE